MPVRRVPALSWLQVVALTVWAALFNLVGLMTWRHGRQTFGLLLAAAVLLVVLPRLVARGPRGALRRPRRSLGALVLAGTVAMAGHLLWGAGAALIRQPSMTDIPRNTWQAGAVLLRGENPYATRCQLWADLERGPHVRQTREGVELYGVPYRYGFPYFPGMLIGYLPARLFGLGEEGLRVWNLVLSLATAWLLGRLVQRLAPGRPDAPLVALAAYLAVWVYPQEIFAFAVVDLFIAGLAVAAFLALAHGRWGLCGALGGLAQSCKLLPMPVVMLALACWAWGRPELRRLLGGYLLASAAVILPFVAWGPAEFLSATVLFYLVHHARGDTTALYPYLPAALRLPQQVLGFLLTALTACLPARRARGDLGAPLGAGFAAYVVFIAFGRMSHLNYLWSVWPLGCAALAVALARSGPPTSASREDLA